MKLPGSLDGGDSWRWRLWRRSGRFSSTALLSSGTGIKLNGTVDCIGFRVEGAFVRAVKYLRAISEEPWVDRDHADWTVLSCSL